MAVDDTALVINLVQFVQSSDQWFLSMSFQPLLEAGVKQGM